ncbi:FHA domain-containing protein [Candidatus Micrarchaeota archaeon]|nr:FHA domain-containing protein [Candidatus Micrarchaeota archaeon]
MAFKPGRQKFAGPGAKKPAPQEFKGERAAEEPAAEHLPPASAPGLAPEQSAPPAQVPLVPVPQLSAPSEQAPPVAAPGDEDSFVREFRPGSGRGYTPAPPPPGAIAAPEPAPVVAPVPEPVHEEPVPQVPSAETTPAPAQTGPAPPVVSTLLPRLPDPQSGPEVEAGFANTAERVVPPEVAEALAVLDGQVPEPEVAAPAEPEPAAAESGISGQPTLDLTDQAAAAREELRLGETEEEPIEVPEPPPALAPGPVNPPQVPDALGPGVEVDLDDGPGQAPEAPDLGASARPTTQDDLDFSGVFSDAPAARPAPQPAPAPSDSYLGIVFSLHPSDRIQSLCNGMILALTRTERGSEINFSVRVFRDRAEFDDQNSNPARRLLTPATPTISIPSESGLFLNLAITGDRLSYSISETEASAHNKDTLFFDHAAPGTSYSLMPCQDSNSISAQKVTYLDGLSVQYTGLKNDDIVTFTIFNPESGPQNYETHTKLALSDAANPVPINVSSRTIQATIHVHYDKEGDLLIINRSEASSPPDSDRSSTVFGGTPSLEMVLRAGGGVVPVQRPGDLQLEPLQGSPTPDQPPRDSPDPAEQPLRNSLDPFATAELPGRPRLVTPEPPAAVPARPVVWATTRPAPAPVVIRPGPAPPVAAPPVAPLVLEPLNAAFHQGQVSGIPITFEIQDPALAAPVSGILTMEVIKVGKLSSSHLHIDHASVSRMHAVIETVTGNPNPAENGVFVVDLASTGGTSVNGDLINKHKLQSGDVVRFGNVKVTVRFDLSAPRVAPSAATIPGPAPAPSAQVRSAPRTAPAQVTPREGPRAVAPRVQAPAQVSAAQAQRAEEATTIRKAPHIIRPVDVVITSVSGAVGVAAIANLVHPFTDFFARVSQTPNWVVSSVVGAAAAGIAYAFLPKRSGK